ncbi:MAG TPA: hypothetical protein VFE82_11420 [Ramlibacter sp.]|jgi:hypothetical protein|uniref:hypothetical protein n=1 Tax=Ramlibacter sp. TaxID=1917967 RepID=UPI002D3791D3|nr:hypothetical protein [Ramlibacter sp.]HZY19083.1 hypothetical protein [Ramlibacter sp.]
MTPYRNLSGHSGVVAYEVRPGAIAVRFRGGHTYLYTQASAGEEAVAQMQRLARAGRGLSTFIARRQPGYVPT